MRYVFGINPSLAALRSHPEQVERIHLAEGAHQGALKEIVARARKAGLRVDHAPRERLARLVEGGTHQGVVLEMKEYEYAEPEDLISAASAAGEPPLIVVLDGIQDPQNLGAIARSALAFGAHGLVVPKDRAAGVTGVAAKAAAGAIEHLLVARATNLARTLEGYKEQGLWITAATQDGDKIPEQVDLKGPSAVVVGAEGEGIRRLVLERCDFRMQIPMRPEAGSLNASAAAAVVLYEAYRQRRQGEGSAASGGPASVRPQGPAPSSSVPTAGGGKPR